MYMGIAKINKFYRHIDIHLVEKKNLPFFLLYFSSGELISRKLRKIAKNKGYKLNEKGLFKNNKKISIDNEKNIFSHLGIKKKMI